MITVEFAYDNRWVRHYECWRTPAIVCVHVFARTQLTFRQQGFTSFTLSTPNIKTVYQCPLSYDYSIWSSRMPKTLLSSPTMFRWWFLQESLIPIWIRKAKCGISNPKWTYENWIPPRTNFRCTNFRCYCYDWWISKSNDWYCGFAIWHWKDWRSTSFLQEKGVWQAPCRSKEWAESLAPDAWRKGCNSKR